MHWMRFWPTRVPVVGKKTLELPKWRQPLWSSSRARWRASYSHHSITRVGLSGREALVPKCVVDDHQTHSKGSLSRAFNKRATVRPDFFAVTGAGMPEACTETTPSWPPCDTTATVFPGRAHDDSPKNGTRRRANPAQPGSCCRRKSEGRPPVRVSYGNRALDLMQRELLQMAMVDCVARGHGSGVSLCGAATSAAVFHSSLPRAWQAAARSGSRKALSPRASPGPGPRPNEHSVGRQSDPRRYERWPHGEISRQRRWSSLVRSGA